MMTFSKCSHMSISFVVIYLTDTVSVVFFVSTWSKCFRFKKLPEIFFKGEYYSQRILNGGIFTFLERRIFLVDKYYLCKCSAICQAQSSIC